MTILTEGARTAQFIVSEANGYRSREEVTVTVPSDGYEAGTILGMITATGKYVQLAPGASDGSETAAGVLYANQPTAGDVSATVLVRDAELNKQLLTYPTGATASQITAADAALAASGMAMR